MTAQENKQIIMNGLQLFQNGEIAQMLERFHDDAEWLEASGDLAREPMKRSARASVARARIETSAPTAANDAPAATESPVRFTHRETIHSSTVLPSFGTSTGVGIYR